MSINIPAGLSDAQIAQFLSTQSFLFRGETNVMDPRFGATGNGADDDTEAITRAITEAQSVGGAVYLPPGTYKTTAPVVVPNGICVRGAHRDASVINNTTTEDAVLITNPKNTSGYGRTVLEDFGISGVNPANTNAALELQAGGFSFYSFRRLGLGGYHKHGLIVDQAEISSFDDLVIENGNTNDAETTNIWVVNGADRRAGTAQGFTNVIRFSRLQLNNGVQGIVDDGGNRHTYEDGNLNGNSEPCRFAGVTALNVMGLSLESQLATGQYNMLFDDRANNGVNVGPVQGGLVAANTFTANMAATQAMLRSISSADDVFHRGLAVMGNTFYNVLGRTGAIDLTKFGGCRFGPNQDQSNDFHYVGIHNDANANELWPQPAHCAGTAEGVLSRAGVPYKLLGGALLGDPTAYASLCQINAVIQAAAFLGGFTVAAGAGMDLGAYAVDGASPTASDIVLPPAPQTVSLGGLLVFGTITAANTIELWAYNPTAAAINVAANTWNFTVIKRV